MARSSRARGPGGAELAARVHSGSERSGGVVAESRRRSAKPATLAVTVTVRGESRDLHPIVRDEIYRIGYEAIRNAYAHSQATELEIELAYAYDFTLRITDNGTGIEPAIAGAGKQARFGLPGMRERAANIGATLSIVNAAPGTCHHPRRSGPHGVPERSRLVLPLTRYTRPLEKYRCTPTRSRVSPSPGPRLSSWCSGETETGDVTDCRPRARHHRRGRVEGTGDGCTAVVAVLDAGVHLKAFARMDGAPLASIDIALRKARTAALFGANSEAVWEYLQARRSRAWPRAHQRRPRPVRRRHSVEGRC